MTKRIRTDDINLLLPTFVPYVQALLDRLTALGFKPNLFDTLRTPEEALRNAGKGTGIVKSMHLYGAAADIICLDHLWDCRKQKCKFYTALPREAKALGMYAGADWGDPDHVQALPATPAAQNELRRLGTGRSPDDIAAKDAVIRKWLKPAQAA